MNQKITLYHGSEQIIESPTFGLGKQNNDFGLGFYCTESEELAKEWAVSSLRNGFVNRYSLDTEYLKILNLNNPDYTILNWIAVLVAHRLFSIKSPTAQRAKRYLIDNFGVNVNAYDLIIGYRADDSYFDFAASFLNNGISVQQLANAMRLGKLGEQIVIKSKYAFSLLHYDGFSIAEKEKYYVRRKARNDEADQLYSDILEEETDGLYILDIIRGGIQNDDPRIPRNLSEALLGDAFDYAINACGVAGDSFIKLFSVSSVSNRIENGEPSYLLGKSGIETAVDVLVETTGKAPTAKPQANFSRSREYWIGWAVAYYQWFSGRKFSDIFKVLSFEDLQQMYSPLHEADVTKFADIVDAKVREYFADTNLKRIRTLYGCTQAELAKRSNVSLRSIQMYEQRNKDINKASAETVLSLAKVLGCTMEDLLET